MNSFASAVNHTPKTRKNWMSGATPWPRWWPMPGQNVRARSSTCWPAKAAQRRNNTAPAKPVVSAS